MPLIEWNNTFCVGVARFDEDHKKLVNILNSLHDSMKAGKGKETLGVILADLVQYAKQHLVAEEKLMSQYNYPDYTAHKKLHDEFLQKINNYTQELASGKAVISSQIIALLKDWLSNHILAVDKNYGPFFAEKVK